MCGRYTLYTKKGALEERFHAEMEDDLLPNYNVSPTQHMPIITSEEPELIVKGHWGFLPKWAQGKEGIKSMINARSESVTEKPFFRSAIKKHRCLILADGFYEWKQGGKYKIPYRITLNNEEPFAMAGIFSVRDDEEGGKIPSYAIITTKANKKMSAIHKRMPVILKPEDEKYWLDISIPTNAVEELLNPMSSSAIRLYEVERLVNSPKNNSIQLIKAVEKN
jgi:putative SOS response-associated peptidase YedK